MPLRTWGSALCPAASVDLVRAVHVRPSSIFVGLKAGPLRSGQNVLYYTTLTSHAEVVAHRFASIILRQFMAANTEAGTLTVRTDPSTTMPSSVQAVSCEACCVTLTAQVSPCNLLHRCCGSWFCCFAPPEGTGHVGL